MNGVIILDKPTGWTSHDVVNRMRRILGQRSIGHLGTLDPLATGVLPLVTGSLTRLAQFYVASEKTYEGVIRFGFATNTYDADGDAVGEPLTVSPTLDELRKLSAQFVGLIQQVPPPFSAKKLHGIPAYKLARKQQEVVLKAVEVEIKEFVILSVNAGRAHFRARVASGTYMRSVAHEMGQRLGSGAHLETLRRTAVAEFGITQAHTIEEIERHKINREEVGLRNTGSYQSREEVVPQQKSCHSDRSFTFPKGNGSEMESLPRASEERRGEPVLEGAITDLFVHPRQLLPHLPSVTADEPTATRIRSGRSINLPDVSSARQVKVFEGQRSLIAIATRIAGTLFHPRIVFPCS
jgi:tRNA pseudouridine55 synthase